MRLSAAVLFVVLIQIPVSTAQQRVPNKAFIEGVVLEVGSNQPIADAQVRLSSQGPGDSSTKSPAVRRVRTDARGRFSFLHLDPLRYTVSVDAGGFFQQGPQSTVDLSTRSFQTNVVISLIRTGDASGHVVVDGKSAAGVEVRLVELKAAPSGTIAVSAFTDARGDFRIYGIPPGRYYVVAVPPVDNATKNVTARNQGRNNPAARQRYPTTFYPSTLDVARAVPVEIQPGGALRGLDIQIFRIPTYRIRGNLVDTRFNLPVTDRVTIAWHSRVEGYAAVAAINTVEMAANGTFEITDLPAGKYWLEIKAKPPTEGHPIYQTAVPVEIVSSDIERLTVRLSPAVPVRGRITLEGEPVSSQSALGRITVVATPVAGMPGSMFLIPPPPGRLDSDGKFSMDRVAPGDYHLTIRNLPPDVYLKSATIGSVDVLKDGLRVAEPTSMPLDIVLERSPVQVTESKK